MSKIVVVHEPNACNLDALQLEKPVTVISRFVDEEFSNFESSLLEKIIPKKPRGAVEFEQIFQNITRNSYQNYLRHFSPAPKLPKNLKEYEQYKVYLLSKCRSKEGHYRCLNDLYSFEHNYSLKHYIIKEFSTRLLTQEEAISLYRKLAKGTFIIEGLQDVYDFLKLRDKGEMKEFVERKADEVKGIIEENRKQLERAERKAILPLHFDSTLGIEINEIEDSVLPVSSSESYNYPENLDIDFQNLYETAALNISIQNEYSNSLSPQKPIIHIIEC